MRLGQLVRAVDTTGVSGTGVVVHWLGTYRTTVVHVDGVDSVLAIHGHAGNTEIVWAEAVVPRQRKGPPPAVGTSLPGQSSQDRRITVTATDRRR